MRFDIRYKRVLAQLSVIALLPFSRPASCQLTPLGAQLLEECAAAGTCETDDNFGSSVASGNFNGDAFEDLAVGVPGETVGGDADTGAVHIFYGSVVGLLQTGDQIFHQGTDGIDDTAEPGDHFGFAVAAADFNADGFDDLAISAPDEDLLDAVDAGAVWVLFGSASGLTTTASLAFGQATISDSESFETGDRFGYSLAAGRINSGNRADLVIGVPGEDGIPGLENDSGKVHVLYNNGAATLALEQEWTQAGVDCESLFEDNENGDRFGSALAVADFDDDGFADLAVGSPFEDCNSLVGLCGGNNSTSDVGRVHIFTSSAAGLTLAAATCFGTNNGLFSEPEEQNDRFGGAFASADFDGDGVADLCIGSDGESFGTASQGGAVEVIFGVADSGFEAGAQYTQNDADPNQAESSDHFGFAAVAGNFDGDAFGDLAVGVPFDDVSGNADAGEIAVFYGSATGLEAIVPAAFHSDLPPGMPDSPNPFDFFGAALAAGDFDGSGTDDLAIGVPGEDLGAANAAGMVTLLYGLDRATGAFGTVQFQTATATVPESAAGELFIVTRQGGAVLAASVDHARTGGSATPGADFSYTAGSETWDVGDLAANFFTLNILEDTLDEPNETLVIALGNPSAGAAVGTPGTLTITITDNDVGGVVQFAGPVQVFRENAGSATIVVTRASGAASNVTVQFATSNGSATAGVDYTATSGTLTFAANETSKVISVPLLDDGSAEPVEVFLITLSNPGGGATLGIFTVEQVIIVDNELFLDDFESADTSRWSSTVP